MDAAEDDLDVKLQKISGDLIADFDRSLRPFLRKQDGAGGASVRSRVRARETGRLVATLIGPFQELPQLLDSHLPRWLPTLGDAFLEYQLTRRRSARLSARSELLMPLPRAICKIIYTFCKIRGEKVIVRFLSNEAKYLELLLSALEESERAEQPGQWTWEERYVVLLWLSHLMLAPFDLSTISSQEVEDDELVRIPGFQWPAGLPGLTTRILPLAIKYLSSPGKERDASKALLVRISMRRDMQQLGVLDALVRWALSALRPSAEATERTPYHYIGVLSFLAGILASSADTSDMDRHLMTIFHTVHGIAAEGASEGALQSALARKTMIKVIRATAALVLRNPDRDMAGLEMVETTIGFLLESLADNDTPVRFAASKALSVITLKLDPDMASQVVEAVLESLNKNVLHIRSPTDSKGVPKKDLSAVDPLEWHGLMLTLSHLLYRRSPPADQLADIAQALLLGLSFERRSTSGSPTGTNVRDAACFGIWALARRYTTPELLAVPTTALTNPLDGSGTSILQILATELIAAACLDPAGNIRRGSSAALQELIGRHPNTVEEGIWVVQTVDYHAVALRSRALKEVALGATKLSSQYGEAILESLLGWRGVGDADAASRRAAAAAYGLITAELSRTAPDPVQRLTKSVSWVLDRIKSLETRQVEERHGLLLSFAAVLDALPGAAQVRNNASSMENLLHVSMDALLEILKDCDGKTYRRPELVGESASRLIVSSLPVLQAVTLKGESLLPGPSLKSKSGVELSRMVHSGSQRPETVSTFTSLAGSNLRKWLVWQEKDIIDAASEAAVVYMIFCTNAERDESIKNWADAARARQSSKTRTTSGHFAALAAVYPMASTLASEEDKTQICEAIVERWKNDIETDTRTCILQSLAGTELLRQNTDCFLELIIEGLDDYHTNARGDVGSHVRLQAIRATKALWERLDDSPEGRMLSGPGLLLRILRLAAEKLDRVRVEAQAALAVVLKPSVADTLRKSTFSSKKYFLLLLNLLQHDWLHAAVSGARDDPETWMDYLMAGFVSSADTGNEELVIATRAALCEFCEQSTANTDAVCAALARNLKTWQGADRVLVPTLEVTAFLFHIGIFPRCSAVNYKSMCLQVQKACYKTGNVRKIEACVRMYGAIAALARVEAGPASPAESGHDPLKREDGIREARARLGALLFHPWPRVRTMVIDELWGLHHDDPIAEGLKGVDWGRAGKEQIRAIVDNLGRVQLA
ncbi:hypothetical protein VTK26DRAFT_5110 [Humicola hyalothermophila]